MLRKGKLLLSVLGILLAIVVIGAFGLGIRPKATGADAVSLPWDSPPGYRIVYLLAEGVVPADSPIAPSRLEATLGAQTAHTWREVVSLDEPTPIEALVIHDSALSMVDRDWLASAYRRGVVIGAFDVYAPALADLLDDPCIAADGFAAEPYSSSFYVIVSRLILGQPDDVALIEAGPCRGPVAGVRHPAGGTGGRSTYTITNVSDYNIFARVLVGHIEGIQRASRNFERGEHLRPQTSAP
ncbi:MAG: hypothetical protein ACE5LU_08820 [Anaerolineae bacterium]